MSSPNSVNSSRSTGFVIPNVVFFVDDNLISNRAYARELLTQIADRGLRWFGHASVNLANDTDMLELCQRSGCLGVLIGFETLSPETLQSIGRKCRLQTDFLEAIRKIHDHGIGIDGSFVFGFDTDDLGVFDRTLEFVTRAEIEIPYFSVLTPYPGTRLYHRLQQEDRILHRDWSRYDTSQVVIRPRQMSPDQLQEGYLRAFHNAYTKDCMVARLQHTTALRQVFLPMNFGFRDGLAHIEPPTASPNA
jgi:radical SAM superfamily enzyme YgiQ (UPF0313 family)